MFKPVRENTKNLSNLRKTFQISDLNFLDEKE